jgi:hypothetical protein
VHILLWFENLKGKDHLEDLAVDGSVILRWILGRYGWEGADWIHVA